MPSRDDDEPLVVQVLRQYRDALEGMEAGVMDDMGRRWLQIEARLQADIAELEREMLEAQARGQVISMQLIWRSERYQRIKQILDEELKKYNRDFLVPTISDSQVEFGMFGVQGATAAIRASYTTKIAPWFPVINREAVETMAGFLSNGAPLASLLKRDFPEALEGLSNALINGIARGMGPGRLAQQMADGMGMGLDRALVIARTETNRTYRMTSVMQYRKSNVVRGFRRLVKKSTACMACLMKDGELFEKKDDLYDHPSGKCVAVPLVVGVADPRWQNAQDYFLGLSPEEQQARMGGEKYELWKSGAFQLDALAKTSHSSEWGSAPRVATIEELKR